jgi:hypothetical protein
MQNAGNKDPHVAHLSPIPRRQGRTNFNYQKRLINTKGGWMRKRLRLATNVQYKTG